MEEGRGGHIRVIGIVITIIPTLSGGGLLELFDLVAESHCLGWSFLASFFFPIESRAVL